MNYKDAFSIDEVQYKERRKTIADNGAKYLLYNYDYYQPKLVPDFYLKYFIRELLIEIDILETSSFLDFHYVDSKNQKLFIDILKHKIIPKIKQWNSKAQISLEGNGYYKEIKLEDGFIETEGKVFKPEYEEQHISNFIACENLQEDIMSRMQIIENFIEQIEKVSVKPNFPLLKWSGKPVHLAFFISQFIEEGYIDPPRNNDGEINLSELSRIIISSFEFVDKDPSVETLRRYVNISNEEKHLPLKDNFLKQGYRLPNSKFLG